MDIKALDLHQGRIKVISLRSKVRLGLYGASMDDTLSSSTASPLGAWIYRVWIPKYKDLPETKEIEYLNRDAHELCGKIIALKNKGQLLEAREAFKELDICSDKILQKLEEVSQRALLAGQD